MTASSNQSPFWAAPVMASKHSIMSSATSEPLKPTATQLPQRSNESALSSDDEGQDASDLESTHSSELATASKFKLPPLRVHLNDLQHSATNSFVTLINPTTLLPNAIEAILTHLYPKDGNFPIPPTRSVTLILRNMGGVAYTTGLDLDNQHKEIHFALSHIKNCCSKNDDVRRRDEIIGVVTHEMVHCYQYNGLGSAPGGLIEGIADFVRLKAGLSPPHWDRKHKPDRWDAGYQHTAYFLEWIEEHFGGGSVARINLALNGARYKERRFWSRLFGHSIQELWGLYRCSLDEDATAIASKGSQAENDVGDNHDHTRASHSNRPEKTVKSKKEQDGHGNGPSKSKAAEEEELVVIEKDVGVESSNW